jgi:hypothetical protein
VSVHGIDAVVGQGQIEDAGRLEPTILQSKRRSPLIAYSNVRCLYIDTQNVAGRYGLGNSHSYRTGTATYVKYGHTRSKMREQETSVTFGTPAFHDASGGRAVAKWVNLFVIGHRQRSNSTRENNLKDQSTVAPIEFFVNRRDGFGCYCEFRKGS